MTITETKIRKTFDDDGKIKAIVSVTIDNMLVVHDIKIISNENGYFVAMPSRRDENDVYRDVCHPIDSDTREYFNNTIIKAYKNHLILKDIYDLPKGYPMK